MTQQDPKLFSLALELAKNLKDLQSATGQKQSEVFYNLMMKAERALHLDSNPEDKSNGFYDRSLGSVNGELSLQVPRVRNNSFRPEIIPEPFKRDSAEREQLLKALFSSAYSPSATKDVFTALGLSYNESEMEGIRQHFLTEYQTWINRQLSSDFIALFIDAYHAEMQVDGKVRKYAHYTVLGIDFSCKKQLLGVFHSQGAENKGFWIQVFNNLITRGVKYPLLVISDDFSGITDAVSTLFPKALHQLCYIHLQRNIYKNMSRPDAQAFNRELCMLTIMML